MIRCHMLCQPIRILCSLLFQTNFSFLHVKSCPEVNVSSVFKMAYVTKLKFHITRETFIYRLQSQPAVFLKEILAAMQIGFRQNEWTKYHVKAWASAQYFALLNDSLDTSYMSHYIIYVMVKQTKLLANTHAKECRSIVRDESSVYFNVTAKHVWHLVATVYKPTVPCMITIELSDIWLISEAIYHLIFTRPTKLKLRISPTT